MDIQGTHIVFRHDPSYVAKTIRWNVKTKDGELLGRVSWFGRWRRYCFFPADGCVFEETCLNEISQFIVNRTHEHRVK